MVRALDDAQARGAIHVRPEVWMDGGVRRGTDIFKALALGATSVGIGRPTLYGLAAFGQAGAERVLAMLLDELRTAMMLMGVRDVRHIGPQHVQVKDLAHHYGTVPQRSMAKAVYHPLQALKPKANL